jgi:hypothetical protein
MTKSHHVSGRGISIIITLLGATIAAGCAVDTGEGPSADGEFATSGAALKSKPGFAVLGPEGRLLGKTYDQWSTEWWQWYYGAHASTHPVLDKTGEFCGVDQHERVFFLAGTYDGTVSRTCTIPHGKPVFFPIINLGADNCGVPPADQLTKAQLIAAEQAFPDHVTGAEVDIDGQMLGADKTQLSPYLIDVTQFSYVVPPHDNIYQHFGVDFSGRCSPSFSGGYYVMLALTPGDHLLHFAGSLDSGYALDTTYTLHVE